MSASLFDGAGIAQVGEHRAVLLPLFAGTRKLRERDDRDVELLRHDLEASRDLGNFLHAVVDALCAVHQLGSR